MKEPIFNASLTIEATPEGTRWKCKKHLSQKEESRA